jgi:hypothetical protein
LKMAKLMEPLSKFYYPVGVGSDGDRSEYRWRVIG